MLVSDKARLIFVEPPRTGSRSLVALFQAALPDCRWEVNQHLHTQLSEEYNGYKWVLSVRNPFTRLISSLNGIRHWSEIASNPGMKDPVSGLTYREAFRAAYEEHDPLGWKHLGPTHEWHLRTLSQILEDPVTRVFFLIDNPDAPWRSKNYDYYKQLSRVTHYIRLESMVEDVHRLEILQVNEWLRANPFPKIAFMRRNQQYYPSCKLVHGDYSHRRWWPEFTKTIVKMVVQHCHLDFQWVAGGIYSADLLDAVPDHARDEVARQLETSV